MKYAVVSAVFVLASAAVFGLTQAVKNKPKNFVVLDQSGYFSRAYVPSEIPDAPEIIKRMDSSDFRLKAGQREHFVGGSGRGYHLTRRPDLDNEPACVRVDVVSDQGEMVVVGEAISGFSVYLQCRSPSP